MLPFVPILADVHVGDPADAWVADRPVERRWMARAHVGYGSIADSPEERLLGTEGYGGGRWWFMGDGAWMPKSFVGIGGFVAYTSRNSDEKGGGPQLVESTVVWGAQGPLVWDVSPEMAIVFTPRLGLAHWKLGFGGDVRWRVAPFVGADLGFVFREVRAGFAIGYAYAPTGAPGDVGRRYDVGGLMFLFTVFLDG